MTRLTDEELAALEEAEKRARQTGFPITPSPDVLASLLAEVREGRERERNHQETPHQLEVMLKNLEPKR